MEFKWLSEIDRKSPEYKKFLEKLPQIGAETRYGKEQVLKYAEKENFDCLLCFEKGKFVACCAASRNLKEKDTLKAWLIYSDPAFRKKGYARALSAELAKRAQSEGFKYAELGAGGKFSARLLASAKRKRRQLGLRGFRIEPKTGNVSFPRKKRK